MNIYSQQIFTFQIQINKKASAKSGAFYSIQSAIANLLKEKNDTRIVQKFAVHRKTGSIEAYIRIGVEELKSSIEQFHPRQ